MNRYWQLKYVVLAIITVLLPASVHAQHPLAKRFVERSQFKGPAGPDLHLRSMRFAFQLQNRAGLEQLLAEQQASGSSLYHHWLTRQEFGARFGVSEDEYQQAVTWLQSQGFTVTSQPGNRLRIYFEGSAAQVNRAFGVNMGLYEFQGKTYYSNDVSPQIPLEFQAHAQGIYGLDNFPKVHHLYQFGGNDFMAPADAQVAYNLTTLESGGIDGTGQSIAIVETSDFNISDVQQFRSLFGLPPNDPQKIFVNGNPGIDTAGGEQEALLDTEWAGGIAKGATIQVVITGDGDIQTSLDYIVNQLFTTRVISVSFGDGETDLPASQAANFLQFLDSFFMQASAQGQTVFVASGDDGAQQALGTGQVSTGPDINLFCSSAFVVCVGGTTLNVNFDSSGNVTQYLGETVWNNGQTGSSFAASGGGKSRYIAKPAYQTGPGVPADGQRDVPDIGAVADPIGPGALIVLNGRIDNHTYGGTSLSTPMWAGVFALVNQFGSSGGVGWANPRLYQLGTAQQSGGLQVFHDVTTGNNTTPTVAGFSAGSGFDLATGWGSMNGDTFVRNFSAQPAPPTVVTMDSNPTVSSSMPPSPSPAACGLNSTQYTITVPAGALQLIVTLNGPLNGDVDLYVRKGQPVVNTGFNNPFISDFRSEGSTPHETVYVGPNSTIPLSAGTYYIATSNCDNNAAAAFTLSATVITPSSSTKIEELLGDNGLLDDAFNNGDTVNFPSHTINGALVVNRLRPSHYPSTLTKIRIYSALWDSNHDPAGQSMRIIAFNDPAGTGTPPSPTPTLLVNQTVTVPGSNGFMEYTITGPAPTIQSGDWYVGFQQPSTYNGIIAAVNENGVWQQAGFVSTNNGVSFTGPYQQANASPPPTLLNANFMIRAVAQSQVQTSSTFQMNVPSLGAVTSLTHMANSQLQVGYATASVGSGSTPFGTAVFSYSPSGIVVTEVGVPASPPTVHGRIFIDFRTNVAAKSGELDAGSIAIDTGMALVNRGAGTAHITFTLSDRTGAAISGASGTGTLAAGAHTAIFIDQLGNFAPGFSLPGNFSTVTLFGSLDITSDQPLSILALRQTTNQRGEALLTSTPIVDMTQTAGSTPLNFPQFADGGGFSTLLILLNTTSSTETGNLFFYLDGGTPVVVTQVGGGSNSTFPYSVPPGGVFVFQTDGSPANINAGSVQAIPNAGMQGPVGAGVFSLTQNGILVTQSGVPSATPTTHAHIFVDTSGGHDTGLAMANPSGSPITVTLAATQSDGVTAAGTSNGPVPLPANGHAAKFVEQFISALPPGFTGVLDISSAQPFAALTLRSLTNGRGETLLTTFPIADFNQTPVAPLVFPQIVDSGGFQSEIILLSTSNSGTSGVTVNYLDNSGAPIALKSGR
ncbi:MAG: protease pro-enzyme activation domain-containing protein [Acidobacteriia bacterium]|nr:protease pro-enzyme activation domain-containing protein [Terriglobia bacterium]